MNLLCSINQLEQTLNPGLVAFQWGTEFARSGIFHVDPVNAYGTSFSVPTAPHLELGGSLLQGLTGDRRPCSCEFRNGKSCSQDSREFVAAKSS